MDSLKKYAKANQRNFMDKELDQAIMVRSKLRNEFLKLKTDENRLTYVREPNHWVKLLRQKKNGILKT